MTTDKHSIRKVAFIAGFPFLLIASVLVISMPNSYAGGSPVCTSGHIAVWDGTFYVVDGTQGDDTIDCSNLSVDLLIKGGHGDDRIRGGSGNDLLQGGHGNDRLVGNNGNDTIQGGLGDDELLGGNGNDTISGGRGVDIINGGNNFDTCDAGNPKDGDPAPTNCEA